MLGSSRAENLCLTKPVLAIYFFADSKCLLLGVKAGSVTNIPVAKSCLPRNSILLCYSLVIVRLKTTVICCV